MPRARGEEVECAAQWERKYGLAGAAYPAPAEAWAHCRATCLAARAEHVDCDHAAGKVPAVLCFICFNCNAALGHFKDRPDALRRAAAYLEGIVWKPTRVAPGVYRLPS
ncbi:endonuclease domain-containing protein [Yinghuangia soli]|uniref:endonuclease domain-containing protein n=1 Tax=Yinghuangia soli TaxID=2908204 RepID=UPI00228663D0|nr:endonuclease domain-containing protein [Yinghuangia soli]